MEHVIGIFLASELINLNLVAGSDSEKLVNIVIDENTVFLIFFLAIEELDQRTYTISFHLKNLVKGLLSILLIKGEIHVEEDSIFILIQHESLINLFDGFVVNIEVVYWLFEQLDAFDPVYSNIVKEISEGVVEFKFFLSEVSDCHNIFDLINVEFAKILNFQIKINRELLEIVGLADWIKTWKEEKR